MLLLLAWTEYSGKPQISNAGIVGCLFLWWVWVSKGLSSGAESTRQLPCAICNRSNSLRDTEDVNGIDVALVGCLHRHWAGEALPDVYHYPSEGDDSRADRQGGTGHTGGKAGAPPTLVLREACRMGGFLELNVTLHIHEPGNGSRAAQCVPIESALVSRLAPQTTKAERVPPYVSGTHRGCTCAPQKAVPRLVIGTLRRR